MKCNHCDKETINPKFCSRSCAAKANNKLYPKRKPENTCINCGGLISTKWIYCKECSPGKIDYNLISLSDIAHLSCYVRQSRIRDHSRRTYLKSNKPIQELIDKYGEEMIADAMQFVMYDKRETIEIEEDYGT
jgi:hypothetical protein